MTFGSVIRILVVGCLVGPALTMPSGSLPCGGFSVRKAKNPTAVGQTLLFQNEITNLGGWDQTTGYFTAPCAGAYSFSFSAISPENNKVFRLALMKGGQYQVTAYGTENGYQTGTNSALLRLDKDDVVNLQLQEGNIYEFSGDQAYTSFTGFLVDEL